MQSGCPRSQGGGYSAFHHWSNTALLSPLDIDVAPTPVVHPGTKLQKSMVATQYPGELIVAYCPSRLQQPNFQGLQHQQESQASIGFQHQVPGNSACSSPNSHHQASRDANANSYSSTHVCAPHRSNIGTLANQKFYNSGQQSKCSEQKFGRQYRKRSNLNDNTGLLHLNCASSTGTNSAALEGDGTEVAAQTFPLQEQHSLIVQKCHPLLSALLKVNPSDSFTTSPSLSQETDVKGQQVKNVLPAIRRTQSLGHSGGTPSTHQQQVSFPSLSSQPSTDNILPVGEMEPCTDEEIYDFIAQAVAYYTSYGLTSKELVRDSKLQSDFVMPKVNSVTHLPSTSASDKDVERQNLNCTVIEECTTALGQALEEDCSKGRKANAELTPRSKETDDRATSASEKHPTGTLDSAVENSKHPHANCKLVYSDEFRDKTFVGSYGESFYSKRCDKYLQKGMTPLHYSSTALKELIASLENVETIAEMENFSKVILQQYWKGNIDNVHLFASTEYPQIMMNVAATCTKNEDESPGVLTAVPGMTWAELQKQPSSMLNRSSSQQYVSPWLHINKNMDDIDQVPRARKHMTERKKGDTVLKPVKAVGLDSVQGVTDVLEDIQIKPSSAVSENKTLASLNNKLAATIKKKNSVDIQQHCGVTCKEVIAHSALNSPVDKIQIHNVVSIPINQSEWLRNQTSREVVREDAGSVRSKSDLSIALSESKVTKPAPLSESKGKEAHPYYEDISDDETSQPDTKLPNTEHAELNFPACFKVPQYDDISDFESSQNEDLAVPDPNDKWSPFENEGYGHGQGQHRMPEIISNEELIPKKQVSPKTLDIHCPLSYVETVNDSEDILHRKCDRESQTKHSVSSSSFSVLKYEDETDDDQTDDDFLVIPISILDLKFEPEHEDQDSPENVLEGGETGVQERQSDTSPTHRPSPKTAVASAFPVIPVYDTHTCFLQAVQLKNRLEVAKGRSTPEHEMDSEGEAQPPQNRRDSVDSCQTEDSCDYSSASERNYLTVSRKMLKKRSAALPSETDVFASEKGCEHSEFTYMQKGQTRRMDKSDCLQKPGQRIKAEYKISGDIITIDSDTEGESDQTYKKKARRKRKEKRRLFSLDSEDSNDGSCSLRKRSSPVDNRRGTVKEKFPKNRLPSVGSPAPQHQSGHDSPFEEAASEHVQHKTSRQKFSKRHNVIILDTEEEDDDDDDDDQNYERPRRKRFFSSSSEDSPCVEPETVDSEYESAKETPQKTRLSSADSSLPQQFTGVKRDACSDLSNSIKKRGQPIEAKDDSEHAQHKAHKLTTSIRKAVFQDSDTVVRKGHSSQKKASTNGIPSSGLEDSDVDRSHGIANKKPQKKRPSSDDLAEKQPQSVDKEAEYNPVIPRLVVVNPLQPSKRLKLFRESKVHWQEKDGTRSLMTSTASSKKTDSSFSHLHRHESGRFVPKPANDRLHAPKSNIQATVPKPRMVSTPPSLPRQEAPATSYSSSSSTSGQLSEARRNSASSRGLSPSGETSPSCSIPTSKQSTSIPRRHLPSSKPQWSRSLTYPPTKGPSSSATMQSSPLKCDGKVKVIENWQNSYFPTRRDRKSSLSTEESLRATADLRREARPGPSHIHAPRQRYNPFKATTPLMKKTRSDAIRYTKARKLDIQNEKRSSVGEGSKCSEGNSGKAYRRRRRWERYKSPPRIYE